MSRLVAMAAQDLRSQLRHGIVGAVALVSAVWIVLLRLVGSEIRDALLPVAVYTDVGVVGFLFVGGQVLIERRQRSLAVLGVSPLRPAEYIAAKVGTLTALAIAASAAVVVAADPGAWTRLPLIVLAVSLLSVPALLIGLIAAARVDDVTRYILTAQFFTAPAILPLLAYAGVFPDALAALVPSYMPLRVLADVTGAEDTALLLQLAGCAYTVAATWWFWRLARSATDRRLLREVPV